MHDITYAFFDTFGDFDFAFTGQQVDRTHLAHVHADRVGGAANIGFNGGKGCCCFFGGGFVRVGCFFSHQQGIGIGSSLKDVDPHVVDHANNVFNLFRIGNIFRQMVVDFGVRQVTLLTPEGDQFF